MFNLKLSRRSLGGLGAGAVVAAPKMSELLRQSVETPATGGVYPPSWSPQPPDGPYPETAQANVPPRMLLNQPRAIRAIFDQFPEMRKIAESALYADMRWQITHIDPDIDVHRSFSRAAKIVYQRQRMVENRMAFSTHDEDETWAAKIFKPLLNKFMWGQ